MQIGILFELMIIAGIIGGIIGFGAGLWCADHYEFRMPMRSKKDKAPPKNPQ